MKKWITERMAFNGLLLLLTLTIIFHLLVLAGLLPPDLVWGGGTDDWSEIWKLELISLAVNGVIVFILCIYAGFIPVRVNALLMKLFFWLLFVLFALNTLGNIFSSNELESWIFTPITALLALFSLRLAMGGPGFSKQVGQRK